MSAQTPQTDADVRISELEEIYRAHVRDIVGLRTENDRLKALCEELREALGKMIHQAIEASSGLTEAQANEIDEARAALKKAEKDI
jgi:hypothetical protein